MRRRFLVRGFVISLAVLLGAALATLILLTPLHVHERVQHIAAIKRIAVVTTEIEDLRIAKQNEAEATEFALDKYVDERKAREVAELDAKTERKLRRGAENRAERAIVDGEAAHENSRAAEMRAREAEQQATLSERVLKIVYYYTHKVVPEAVKSCMRMGKKNKVNECKSATETEARKLLPRVRKLAKEGLYPSTEPLAEGHTLSTSCYAVNDFSCIWFAGADVQNAGTVSDAT